MSCLHCLATKGQVVRVLEHQGACTAQLELQLRGHHAHSVHEPARDIIGEPDQRPRRGEMAGVSQSARGQIPRPHRLPAVSAQEERDQVDRRDYTSGRRRVPARQPQRGPRCLLSLPLPQSAGRGGQEEDLGRDHWRLSEHLGKDPGGYFSPLVLSRLVVLFD